MLCSRQYQKHDVCEIEMRGGDVNKDLAIPERTLAKSHKPHAVKRDETHLTLSCIAFQSSIEPVRLWLSSHNAIAMQLFFGAL